MQGGKEMNKKDTSNMMKIMGATLAVCSAAAIMGGMKTNSFSAKKNDEKSRREGS